MLLSTLLQYCSSPSCEAAARYLLPIGSVGGDLFIVAGRTIGVKCHHLSKKSLVIGEAYVGIGSFLYQTHNNKGLGMLFASPYDAADSSWYESMLPLPPSSNTPTISSMGTTPSIGPGWVVSSASLGKIQRTALPATPHR